MYLVKNSYKDKDCVFLLKDISKDMVEVTIEEKEALINKGVNYSEMLSKEDNVSDEIKGIFKELTLKNAKQIAYFVGAVSEQIYDRNGDNTVLVSLARAGTPYGILIKHYIKEKYNVDMPHYSVSIVRGKGIDFNALNYILKCYPTYNIQFIDGWTGKGSITKELNKSITEFNEKFNFSVSSSLAVIADPAKKSLISGTKKDINLPNCCLNSTVSGLISRTVHNEKFIKEDDFHGAKYLGYLEGEDFSNFYINEIEKEFTYEDKHSLSYTEDYYVEHVLNDIKEKYNVADINKIKFSIGEASRALLRRKTKLVLVKDFENEAVGHILHMAKEKGVKIEKLYSSDYECIAIIE